MNHPTPTKEEEPEESPGMLSMLLRMSHQASEESLAQSGPQSPKIIVKRAVNPSPRKLDPVDFELLSPLLGVGDTNPSPIAPKKGFFHTGLSPAKDWAGPSFSIGRETNAPDFADLLAVPQDETLLSGIRKLSPHPPSDPQGLGLKRREPSRDDKRPEFEEPYRVWKKHHTPIPLNLNAATDSAPSTTLPLPSVSSYIAPLPLFSTSSPISSNSQQAQLPPFAMASNASMFDFPNRGSTPAERSTAMSSLQRNLDSDDQKRCNCKRSRCIKLYCECFAAEQLCTSQCKCHQCLNTHDHFDKVIEARSNRITVNPGVFDSKAKQKGCHCKTGCSKRYCECFQAGVACSSACSCVNCINNKSSPTKLPPPNSSAGTPSLFPSHGLLSLQGQGLLRSGGFPTIGPGNTMQSTLDMLRGHHDKPDSQMTRSVVGPGGDGTISQFFGLLQNVALPRQTIPMGIDDSGLRLRLNPVEPDHSARSSAYQTQESKDMASRMAQRIEQSLSFLKARLYLSQDSVKAELVHQILCNRTSEINGLVQIWSKSSNQDAVLRTCLTQNFDTLQQCSMGLSRLFDTTLGNRLQSGPQHYDHVGRSRELLGEIERWRACVMNLVSA